MTIYLRSLFDIVRPSRIPAVLILLILIPSHAWATLIDSFAAPTPAVVNTTAGAGDVVIDGPRVDASILGERTIIKSGNELETGDEIVVGNGVFSAFTAGDATWPMQLLYDFSGEPGGSISWAADTGLYLTFSLIDSDDLTYMDSIVWIDTVSGTLELIGSHHDNLAGGERTDLVPFASFSGTGDLSQVTGLRYRFNDPLTALGLDFTLTRLATHPIPEPAGMMLMLSSVMMASLCRRRKFE